MPKFPSRFHFQWIVLACGLALVILMKIGMHSASLGDAAQKVEPPTDTERAYYDIIVRLMEDRDQVRGAAMTRRNRIFNLVLIVDAAISPDFALDLGNDFVRMAKSYLDEFPNPENELGISRYAYLVKVYDPDKQVIAEGAKYPLSRQVKWQR